MTSTTHYRLALFERFVDQRLVGFRTRTRMWGSREAIELQALQLVEAELRLREPWIMKSYPRLVMDYYVHAVGRKFDFDDARSLSARIDGFESDEHFAEVLVDLIQAVRRALRRRGSLPVESFPLPGSITSDTLVRSLLNVQEDAKGDWLKDPWGMPELEAPDAVRQALYALRSRPPAICSPIDVAKDGHSQRPAVVLPPIDRLSYQIVVDSVADRLLEKLSPNVYGWRTSRTEPTAGVYLPNSDEWREFKKRVRVGGERHRYYARLDIRDFFGSLTPDRIIESIESLVDAPTCAAIDRLLRTWAQTPGRSGLPQRSLASSVIANHFLMPIDTCLSNRTRGDWCRWMDDIYVFSNSFLDLTEVCGAIESNVGLRGLAINPAKTELRECRLLEFASLELSDVDEQFASGDRERAGMALTAVVQELVKLGSSAPRSALAFAAHRVLRENDIASARLLAAASDQFPHGADRLARMVRALGLFRERVDWYLDFVRQRPASTDWAVAAWATMFADDFNDNRIAELFVSAIRFGSGAQALLPIAACRLVQWKYPGVRGLLSSRLARASHPSEVRALTLALAQAGAEPEELRLLSTSVDHHLVDYLTHYHVGPTWDLGGEGVERRQHVQVLRER